ncbi:MAG: DUF4249 family protein [Ignavibacteria bacterium]|jgi:hypothetical protein
MKKFFSISLLLTVFLIVSCEDPVVDIEEISYEPKLVIEAYISPEEPVKNIYLKRNLAINTTVDSNELYLNPFDDEAEVKINGIELSFDEETKSYYSEELNIEFNKNYILEASASVDGKTLYTKGETTTPGEGFKIIEDDLGEKHYTNYIGEFNITTSPTTTFYALSIIPLQAHFNDFIQDNAYYSEIEKNDFKDIYNEIKFISDYYLEILSDTAQPLELPIYDYYTYFYSKYRLIMYTGNEEFKKYLLTTENLQEADGNFNLPQFNLEGDGIGVFTGVVKDTVFFEIVK